MNSSEITDTCLDLTLQNKFGLKELIVRLEDSASVRQQMELINDFLTRHIYGNHLNTDKGLDFAVRTFYKDLSVPGCLDTIAGTAIR